MCTGLAVVELIADVEPDNTAKVTAKQEQAKGDFEAIQGTFIMGMNKAQGARPKTTKTKQALKPFVLELDSLPHKYRKWKKSMASY